jgi:uncharacterized protein YuzB (UPF0349 family)
MYINGHTNKADVIQNVIENIDDGLLANAKDMLNQLKKKIELDVVEYSTKEESDIDISLNLEAEEQIGK